MTSPHREIPALPCRGCMRLEQERDDALALARELATREPGVSDETMRFVAWVMVSLGVRDVKLDPLVVAVGMAGSRLVVEHTHDGYTRLRLATPSKETP